MRVIYFVCDVLCLSSIMSSLIFGVDIITTILYVSGVSGWTVCVGQTVTRSHIGSIFLWLRGISDSRGVVGREVRRKVGVLLFPAYFHRRHIAHTPGSQYKSLDVDCPQSSLRNRICEYSIFVRLYTTHDNLFFMCY